MIADLLREMLEELGCDDVAVAYTLTDGLDHLERGHPDVAILDIHLGTDLVEPIADRLRGAQTPFIYSSGFHEHELRKGAFRGIFLSLPYTLYELERALSAALSAE